MINYYSVIPATVQPICRTESWVSYFDQCYRCKQYPLLSLRFSLICVGFFLQIKKETRRKYMEKRYRLFVRRLKYFFMHAYNIDKGERERLVLAIE